MVASRALSKHWERTLPFSTWVSRKRVTINGTQQQYETALAIMDGRHAVPIHFFSDDPPRVEGDCPICFCEAESPINTSCKHTYCLECFEECCRSAASTSKEESQIKCQGNEGMCSTVFTLREVQDHISSPIFETILKSAFEEYVQRHPQALRYCPTPDCGYVYRCTATSSSRPLAHMCLKCFEPLCTSCHSRHEWLYMCRIQRHCIRWIRGTYRSWRENLRLKIVLNARRRWRRQRDTTIWLCAGTARRTSAGCAWRKVFDTRRTLLWTYDEGARSGIMDLDLSDLWIRDWNRWRMFGWIGWLII